MSLSPEPPGMDLPTGPAPTGPAQVGQGPVGSAPASPSQPGPEPTAASHMRATWTAVTVALHERWLFKDFSYAVPDGGIVGIVGPRGPALDAALLALVGRYPLDSGNVSIVDAPGTVTVAHLDHVDIDDPLLTVAEYVGQTARSTAPTLAQANIAQCITAVGLHELTGARLNSLTAVQRLRAALAAAAATGANVIALNAAEAVGEADEDELWQLLAQLAGTGRLVLAGSPRPHPAMNLVLSIPHGLEVPA